jgi:DNA-binding NarL/FixJ family response regulator
MWRLMPTPSSLQSLSLTFVKTPVDKGHQELTALVSETTKPLHENLSEREYQVMCWLASGKTIRAIGKELFLSVRTVRTYRARVLDKLNMKPTQNSSATLCLTT